MNERLIVMAVFMAAGVLFLALGLPLARGSVPPNWIYGFRLPQTVKNPDLWYPANALAGRWLIGLGVVLFLAAPALYFAPLGDEAFVLALMLGMGLGVVVMFVACMKWLADRLRRG